MHEVFAFQNFAAKAFVINVLSLFFLCQNGFISINNCSIDAYIGCGLPH